jgi:PAS domain S-box-containing protein
MMNRHPTHEDLDLLTEVSQMLTILDREQLLERLVEFTSMAFGAERGSLMLNPSLSNEWAQVLFQNKSGAKGIIREEDQAKAVRFARRVMTQGLAGWVARHKRGVVILDTLVDDRWVKFEDSTSSARSALCVPFVFGEDVIGVLTLQHSETDQFDENDLRLLTIIAHQATVALRNAQLFHQVQQQRRQLQGVLRAMPDILMVLDEQGHLLLVNEAAATWLETTSEGAAGQRLQDFNTGDSILGSIRDVVESPLHSGQTWSFEARSDALQTDFLVNISVWESEGGGRAGYVVVVRDVTMLRDLNRFKDEMLHIASHDLRSPLALIIGYCSLIALDIEPESPINSYLEAIQKATSRMQGLLDDLLRVEKIRTSPQEVMEPADLEELVYIALNDARPHADQKNLSIQADVSLTDTPRIRMNSALIRETIQNLLDNAIKYTRESGKVTVHAYQDGGRVYVIVEDSGIGISPSELPRVFEAFYRVRQPGMEGIEGRGLGLHLVKTIIERHNGQVWVESEPGQGSRFGFSLPVR